MPLFTVTSVSPDKGPSSGGFKVFVRGTGFESGLDLHIGNLSCSDIQISQGGTLISATAPAQPAGVYDVTVFNSLNNFKTLSNSFTYTQVVSLGGLVQATPPSIPAKVGGPVQTTAVTVASSSGSPAIQILGVPGGPPVITADISRDTFDPNKNYDKLLFQQGRPLLDAELNELQDIVRGKFVDVVEGAIGNGPLGDGFRVEENVADPINKVLIRKGTFFHEGTIVSLHSDFILSGLTTPMVDREDIVYCVYCFEEIDSTEDPNIKDVSVGVETARRIKISVQIFIAEGSLLTIPPDGCKAFPIAQIHRHATCAFVRQACPCCVTIGPFPDCAPCTPCHNEGDIIDLRTQANANYCVAGVDVTATGGLAFSWTAGKVICNGQFVTVAAGSGSVPASSVIYLYVDPFGAVLQSGSIPATVHVLKARITSDGAGIVEIEDQCIYLPRTGVHDHNSPDIHLNLQGGDITASELYHITHQQHIDVFNEDGGETNVADDWHKHGLRGLVVQELDDRYVNVVGDTMTGDLIMSPSFISASLTGTKQETFDIVGGFNDQFIISVDGSGPDVVFLTAGILQSAQAISDNLNTLFQNHIPQINATAGTLYGRLTITSFSVGATSTLAISGNAADYLGFGVGNDTAAGMDAPAIRSNFVTYEMDGGTETPRIGSFFAESDLPTPIDGNRPAMDIVGAGPLNGVDPITLLPLAPGTGRLIRMFDDVNIYGDLNVVGSIFVGGKELHHNALTGLQGGITYGGPPDEDERYHLSQSEWETLTESPFIANPLGSAADLLHSHTLFSDVRLYADPVATRGNPHIQAAPGAVDLGPVCGVVADSLFVVGVGNAPNRELLFWDNVHIADNICWAGLGYGHIGPIADFQAIATLDVVAFDAQPPSGDPEPTHYTWAGDSPVVLYEWNYNYNGVTFVQDATGATQSHNYGADGTYTVALRVTNQHGHVSALCVRQITCGVVAGTPVAIFTPTVDLAADPTGHTFTLDGTASTAGGVGLFITTYEWDFNYPSSFVALGAIVHDHYFSTGVTVALRVTNQVPTTSLVTTHAITIGGAPPVASFTINPTDAGDNYLMDEPYTLTSTASGGSGNFNYEWDLSYDGITFNVEKTSSTVTGTMLHPHHPTADTNVTFAHRVFDITRNVFSNIATKAVNIFAAPQFDQFPFYMGVGMVGQYDGNGAQAGKLEATGDQFGTGPWVITIKNSLAFSNGWTATWAPVPGTDGALIAPNKFRFVQNSNLQATIDIPNPNVLTNDLAPFSIEFTVTVSKPGRTFSGVADLELPISIIRNITSSTSPDGSSGQITVTANGFHLDFIDPNRFKIFYHVAGNPTPGFTCPAGSPIQLSLTGISVPTSGPSKGKQFSATVTGLNTLSNSTMCCDNGNHYRVIFLDLCFGVTGYSDGNFDQNFVGTSAAIKVRFPAKGC